MLSSLSEKILDTLCYYDCLDMPLTAFELWRNLINRQQLSVIDHQDREEKFGLWKIIDNLDKDDLRKYIEEFQGFYFLRGRKSLVGQRIKREKISSAKIKKMRKYLRILRFVPYVRMIALTGRLAMKNAEIKSDWDVLVVLEKGKIWTGRTLITLVSHLFGIRRHNLKIKDRICLNHFITLSSLEIKLQDLFSAHEYSWIRPVFDTGIFVKFQVRNSWIIDYRSNFSLVELEPLGITGDSQLSKKIRKILEYLLSSNILEDKLRVWQMEKIKNNPKTNLSGSYIEATDEALVFLPEPQGPKVYECYMEKIKRFSL